MNLQNILQTVRLKLEHNQIGQFIMLLVSPFYARPHHFRDKENFIIARVAPFAPILIAWMFSDFTTSSMLQLIERQYASMHFITTQVGDAFDQVGRISFWAMLFCIALFIYVAATAELTWHNLARRIWQQLAAHQIKPAPYTYYIMCWSSKVAWFLVMAYASLYVVKNGIARTLEMLAHAFDNYPYVTFISILAVLALRQIKEKNEFSSAMEIYGSKKIVFISYVVMIMLVYSMLFLYSIVLKFINS